MVAGEKSRGKGTLGMKTSDRRPVKVELWRVKKKGEVYAVERESYKRNSSEIRALTGWKQPLRRLDQDRFRSRSGQTQCAARGDRVEQPDKAKKGTGFRNWKREGSEQLAQEPQ